MKRREVLAAQETVRQQLVDAGITLEPDAAIEVANFGLNDYARQGLGLVVRVNTPEYCFKFLSLLPG